MQNRVRHLRRSQEETVSQKKLAEAIGISRGSLSAIENGGNTSDEIVIKLANYFKTDPREIFFEGVVASDLQQ